MSEKKSESYMDYGENEITDVVKAIYVSIIFSIYLICTHNKYFDITKTRYTIFIFASLLFLMLYMVAKIIAWVVYDTKTDFSLIKEYKVSMTSPVFWMGTFLICNTFSFAFSADKVKAFNGASGRYMGYLLFFVMCVASICLAKGIKTYEWLYLLFLVTTLFSYIVAIGQHMGNDFMHLRDNISKKQFYKFVSTFGNINIFASFVVISLGVAIAVFVFSKRIVYRIVAGLAVMLGGITIMIANSDSGYVGLFAVIVVLVTLAIYDGYIKKMCICLTGLAFGNLSSTLLNHFVVKKYDRQGGIGTQGGIAQLLDNIKLATIIFATMLTVTILVVTFEEKINKINRRKAVIFFMTFVGICIVVFVAFGRLLDLSVFNFDYEWGTYRGYIWRKCAGIFNESALVNKFVGYGQETVRMLTVSNFHDEMIEVTGKVYDNAHNELLQYLLTIGIAGLVAYIGMVVSSFIYILKNEKRNVITYISLAVMAGYFAQSIINLDQPITTPLFFVFMALGVGNTTYLKKASKS